MKTRGLLLLILVSFAANAADPVDDTLSKLLTQEQQSRLNLQSLTKEQRAALLEILAGIYAAGRSEAQQAKAKAAEAMAPAPRSAVIESKIDGDFEGWEGDTMVKLMNGQIWQQTDYHYEYHYAFMPDVLIYPSGSAFKMKVEGVDKAVGVKRLK